MCRIRGFPFYAVTNCRLDLQSLPVLCKELIEEWKSLLAYLTLHVPQHQGQGVRTRVSGHFCPNLEISWALGYMRFRSKLLYQFCGATLGFVSGAELRMVTHL